MEDILRRDRLRSDARLGKRHVLGNLRIEVVADHEHVEVLVERVHGERARRIGRRREDIGFGTDPEDIRRVPAAGALGVEGVDGALADCREGALDEPRLVQGIRVDRHLDIHLVGDGETGIDRPRRRSPILVELEADGARPDLLAQRIARGAVPFAHEPEVDRVGVCRLQHAVDIPAARRTGRGVGARGRTGAATQHGGDPAGDGLVDLLRTNKMDVGIDPACRDDAPLAGDDLGGRPDDHGMPFPGSGVGNGGSDTTLNPRIARVADPDDAPAFDADVRFHDPDLRIEDERVGDDEIEGLRIGGGRRLAHPVADDLAPPELDLVSVAAGLRDVVLLDFDKEIRIRQAHPVADGRAEHFGILFSVEGQWHRLKLSVDEVVQSINLPRAGQGHEFDLALVAGLEADGRPRRDVEPETAGGLPVEGERGVDLVEVEVAPDLHGAIAGIRHHDRLGLQPAVGFEGRPVGHDDFSGDHVSGSAGGR